MIDSNIPAHVPVYQRTNDEILSDMDLVAVILTVQDWQAIASHLREDADAEGFGPARTALEAKHPFAGEDRQPELFEQAVRHDERLHCHSNMLATERVAGTIEETLKVHGWV